MKYAGVFVLVSNKALSCFEALDNFKLREKTEEAFALYKDHLGAEERKNILSDGLRGRLFVYFVALSYRAFLLKRINQVLKELDETPATCNEKDMALRDRLRTWLKNHSLSQILKWFDCNEKTTTTSEVGMKRWAAENLDRDQLFLKMLGLKNSQQK